MGYVSDGRRSGQYKAEIIEQRELRNDLLNERKFYRVERKIVSPLQTGTFEKEGCGKSTAFFCARLERE